jgi:hypothetical protein
VYGAQNREWLRVTAPASSLFAEMVRVFGDNFDHAGVGAVVVLPS